MKQDVNDPSLDILYEDNHVLVVNKQAGLLTQSNNTVDRDLETVSKEWIKAKTGKPGGVFLHSVHCLDRPVSGIVVLARTSKALSRLNQSMRDKKFHKVYFAICDTPPKQRAGTLENFLFHDEYCAKVVSKDDPKGKKALLHYQVIDTDCIPQEIKQWAPQACLIKIALETGRYHQIRVQLSQAGAPVLGDVKYGSQLKKVEGMIYLHSRRLVFPHPVKGEEIVIQAPFPERWNLSEAAVDFS